MKRSDLIRKLTEKGCVLIRHGSKHDWYQNKLTGLFQPVPRHNEINDFLAVQILKRLES